VAAVHLLADVARLTAEIGCQFKVISTFVEERSNLLRRLCSSQGQTRFVGRIVKAPALGSWDTFNGASGVLYPKGPDHLALDAGVAKSVLADISLVGEMMLKNFSRALRNRVENVLRLFCSSSGS
jgi:hypothetical protein